MAFDPLEAVISVGTSLIDGIFGGISDEAANDLSRELQQQQLDWNEKMWNLNNEYNTPAAQIARMQDAGLNPNLMYGQGTPGNSSSPASSVSPPHIRPVNYMQGLIGMPDSMLKIAQAKYIDAQREKVENTTIPHDTYLAGFTARTEKDKAAVEQLNASKSYLQNLADFTKMQENYYGADKSATWNMMEAQIAQGWRRLGMDAARVAIAKYEAETHRSVSIAQRHYLMSMADLMGSKKVAQDFQNRVNDITESGVVLKIFGDALRSYNEADMSAKKNDMWWIDKVNDYLKGWSSEGRQWVDSVVPF